MNHPRTIDNLKMTKKMKSMAWEDFYLKNQHSLCGEILNFRWEKNSFRSVYIDVKPNIYITTETFLSRCKHKVTISLMPTVMHFINGWSLSQASQLHIYSIMTLRLFSWGVAHVFRSSLLIMLEFYHEILIAGTTVF